MAYAEYEFYKNEYGGTIPEAAFNKYNVKASNEVDKWTYGRMSNVEDMDAIKTKLQYCVCEIADVLYNVDSYNTASGITDGGKGIVKSVSAGSESVTYGATESIYAAMSLDNAKKDAYMRSIVINWLSGCEDKNGILLTYAGW